MGEELCPSAPCEPGAILLGVVRRDRRVGYVSSPVRIDEDFVARVEAEGDVAKRFRFASPCFESHCVHWHDGRCEVSDAVAAHPEPDRGADEVLPHCSIRPHCRWHRQSGSAACRSCPLVITDPEQE
ncbi:MAG TPA: hypothetical protein VFS64_04610 [Solirubrobacterales bacterium]|nr:hypothetical protein [Solirubrobacterales bacterium]